MVIEVYIADCNSWIIDCVREVYLYPSCAITPKGDAVQQTSDEGYILAGGKTSNNIKYHRSVSFDGAEYLLVWEEWNDDSAFLFGAKVDTSGNVNGPFLIYAQNGDVEGASLAKGLNDQLLITWSGWTPEINGQPTNTMRIWGKFNSSIAIEEEPQKSTSERMKITIFPNPFSQNLLIKCLNSKNHGMH